MNLSHIMMEVAVDQSSCRGCELLAKNKDRVYDRVRMIILDKLCPRKVWQSLVDLIGKHPPPYIPPPTHTHNTHAKWNLWIIPLWRRSSWYTLRCKCMSMCNVGVGVCVCLFSSLWWGFFRLPHVVSPNTTLKCLRQSQCLAHPKITICRTLCRN